MMLIAAALCGFRRPVAILCLVGLGAIATGLSGIAIGIDHAVAASAATAAMGAGSRSACATADPESYDEVYACMSSARWTRGLSAGRNRFEGNIGTSSCRTIASTYVAVLHEMAGLPRDKAKKRVPSCEILARATQEIAGRPAYWASCVGYGTQPLQAHMSQCLEGFVSGYYGAAVAVTQKVTGCATAIAEYERGLAAASRQGRLPDSYHRPPCDTVFAMLAGWTGAPAIAAACTSYDPQDVAAHLARCLGKGVPLASLRNCNDVRRVYEALLVEAHGGFPKNYRMLPCSAAAGLLARADAERAEIAERKRAAALEAQQRRAEIQAARNRAINEKARQAQQRYQQSLGAGERPLVAPRPEPEPREQPSSRQQEHPRQQTLSSADDAVQSAPTIAFEKYEQAGVIRALLQGQFEALQANRFGVIVYISHMHHTFSDELMEIDPRCTLLTSSEMDKGLANTALEVAGMGTMDRPASREQMVQAGAEALLGALMMYKDGPQSMMRQGVNQELLKKQGRKDAIRLATEFGCDDEITEKVYENAKRFVLRQPPE